MNISMHPAQDRIANGFGAVAAQCPVAMDLLDPFEVDDRDDADFQIGMAGDADIIGCDCAVKPFVEQDVRVRVELFPCA